MNSGWKCPDNCAKLPVYKKGSWGDSRQIIDHECPDDLGPGEPCPMGEFIEKGTLYTHRIGLKHIPKCDYYFLIARYAAKDDGRLQYLLDTIATFPGEHIFSHEPSLAPSEATFNVFKRHNKAGTWCEKTFVTQYTNLFINDMAQEPMSSSIRDLAGLLDQGKSVCLLCYCWNDKLCHRSILREEFKSCGYTAMEGDGWKDYEDE